MAKVPIKPLVGGKKAVVLPANRSRVVVAAKPGVKVAQKAGNTKKNGITMLEKVQRAEAELASIKDTDPNAKYNLARMKSEQIRIDSNDTEYWIAIAFESYAQKISFLEQAGMLRDDQDTYYSGPELAEKLGLQLTPDRRAYHTLDVNRRWTRFAMPKEGVPPTKK